MSKSEVSESCSEAAALLACCLLLPLVASAAEHDVCAGLTLTFTPIGRSSSLLIRDGRRMKPKLPVSFFSIETTTENMPCSVGFKARQGDVERERLRDRVKGGK